MKQRVFFLAFMSQNVGNLRQKKEMFKGWMKSSSKTIQMKATRVAPAKLRVCCRYTKEK